MADDLESHTEVPKTGVIIPLDVRCGNCYHFNHERAAQYKDICANLGILKIGRPCKYFLANVKSLSLHTTTDFNFADILRQIPSNKLAEYAALINQERVTRRRGFHHGQVVYIRILPDDYVSNYVRAWIMSAVKGRVLVQGIKTNFRGSFLRDSVLTETEFIDKKQFLKVRRRLIDPKFQQYFKWKPKIEPKALKEYEPPTIDDMPKQPIKTSVKSDDDKSDDTIYIRGKNVKRTKL